MFIGMLDDIAASIINQAEKNIADKIHHVQEIADCLRGALMYAMISYELNKGTSKQDLIRCVEKLYDILHSSKFSN